MKYHSGIKYSVVIPAYYSYSTIGATLDSLRNQTCRDFEVIVVNSSPEEKTAEIVKRFPEVRFIQHPSRLYPHAARNIGVEAAKGEFFVFTDPDCITDEDWLGKLDAAFGDGHKALVGAMGLAGTGWMEKGIHLCKFHWLLPGLEAGGKTCAPTASAGYSRDLWERIGPFHGEVFAGDGILSRKAVSLGHGPHFVPGALVSHYHKERFAALCRQRFSRGREYAWVRMKIMETPGVLTWLSLVFSPFALGLVLLRSLRSSVAAGWGKPWLITLPVQTAGHLGWALGESFGALEMLLGKKSIWGSKV